jgi:DNA topoisomerase I
VPRLRRADWASPGWSRQTRGRGFSYLDEQRRPLCDLDAINRIRALAIPPAWRDVWICPHANGHLQAVGVDAAGRRQYLYHEQWRVQRDRQKFDETLNFARSLPGLRQTVSAQLRHDEMTKDRALAFAVRLLDLGFFRIGSEQYADHNETHGLATLERRHVTLHPGNVVAFDYVGKASKQQTVRLVDPHIYQTARVLKSRRSADPSFLAYKNGRWNPVHSQDINGEIKRLAGPDFSAKNFRTWHATVLAAIAVAVAADVTSKSGKQRAVRRAVDEVAGYLGNTPAVCRASYIDPRVFDHYESGETIASAVEKASADGDMSPAASQAVIEEALLGLLTS